jgi:hypothetical protein
MWEPRRLTNLWASTACYEDSFAVFTWLPGFIFCFLVCSVYSFLCFRYVCSCWNRIQIWMQFQHAFLKSELTERKDHRSGTTLIVLLTFTLFTETRHSVRYNVHFGVREFDSRSVRCVIPLELLFL